MKLLLQNGYVYPCPPSGETEGWNSNEHELELSDVCHFEWKHTITVEFKNHAAAEAAYRLTGWRWWDNDGLILEAAYSVQDGYEHPAICTKDMAYCGFILQE